MTGSRVFVCFCVAWGLIPAFGGVVVATESDALQEGRFAAAVLQ